MNEIPLSSYGVASSTPAPVNRMMAGFAADFRDDVDINLGVGYVNEETIPSDHFRLAFEEVLDNRATYRHPLNYGGPTGSNVLIESIRCFLIDNAVGGLDAETLGGKEIIIGPNGASSLLESLAYVLPKGIVITADPMYYIYTNFLERAGFELLTVPEDQHGLRTDLLADKLAALGPRVDDIRMFYVVTVNNPSCVILSNARRRELVSIAAGLSSRLGRKIPVIFDRAYEDLIHDPKVEAPESALRYDDGQIVYEVGTLSKVLAPALRIGYMIGAGGPFMRAMVQRTSDAGFSAPQITQSLASWLLDHQIVSQLKSVRAGYRDKAAAVGAWIDERFGPLLENTSGGQAGFYFYLTFRDIETHEESDFFKFLTRTTGRADIDGPPEARGPRVIYIPGEHCVHSGGELSSVGRRQLRLSYGYEQLDAIDRAISLMKQAAEYAKGHTP
ncbi:MAG: pyridoxal phosphate-dependent aminotransferase [Phycisphaerae bacterium]|jgi:DNA-binding transcriptional MocR family regulator|nr:pyridoxal phosphate-dependent aminotransferase [Phycisphaerae bacterium]MDP7286903.1 pyridoxal phosphate-dependent aminotransferase [Phycisphaerae bacterium]